MHLPSLYSLLPHSIIFFFLITSTPPANSQELGWFSKCNNTFYNCGEVLGVGYPFWGGERPKECGHPSFELTCDKNTSHTSITINSQSFRVFDIDKLSKYTMNITRTDLLNNECPSDDTKLIDGVFIYFPDVVNITLHFNCPSLNVTSSISRFMFKCNESNGFESLGFSSEATTIPISNWSSNEEKCKSKVSVPISNLGLEEVKRNLSEDLLEVLNQGITVLYNGSLEGCYGCEKSNGICWSGTSLAEPTCLCRDKINTYYCGYESYKGLSVGWKVAIGIGAAAIFAIVIGAFWFVCQRRHKNRYTSSYFMSRSTPSDPSSSTMDLEKAGHYHGVPLFDYSELVQATDNFDSKNELGEGGFGTVYRGKLKDGRVVAVKRLYENNYKRVEQFMNEIEILQGLCHRNLVRLYGCTSRHCRELLLVYEYIPNGTIADHLHGEGADPRVLSWSTRLSIAVETASALTYLHASEVIHRDVKTNNILLGDNFCVKVADFGLSRLFPTQFTHVSTAPQGTPGYLDPEYHECYQLTSKSDVYSFGVVLIELISSLPAVDITRHRHEINLSNMAINKIQCNALHELVDKSLGFESDDRTKETISAVAELAFQCLQSGRDMRPSMQEVLESLLEIQSLDLSTEKKDSVGSPTDAPLLLKKNNNEVPSHSPNSVINVQWPSGSTTHSSSSY